MQRVVVSGQDDVIVWSIKQFNGGKEFMMRANFGLPSIRDEVSHGSPRPPLTHFRMMRAAEKYSEGFRRLLLRRCCCGLRKRLVPSSSAYGCAARRTRRRTRLRSVR